MTNNDYTLHLGDCLDYMRQMPDKAVDLLLVDPPYGINLAANPFRQKFTPQDWDNAIPSKEIFAEMLRVSKNQIIWGGNYFNLPATQCFLIWDKIQPEDFSSAMCEMAWTNFKSPAKMFKFKVTSYSKQHPTQKPVPLMAWCIENYSQPRDLIFDPFFGSGTTALAALLLNRRFVGCEISEAYYKIAEKRIREAANDFEVLSRGK